MSDKVQSGAHLIGQARNALYGSLIVLGFGVTFYSLAAVYQFFGDANITMMRAFGEVFPASFRVHPFLASEEAAEILYLHFKKGYIAGPGHGVDVPTGADPVETGLEAMKYE